MKNKKTLEEIASRSNLKWADVTMSPDGYPRFVGEYSALIGFKDQFDAEEWAEETGGIFSMLFKKDGWHLLYPSEFPTRKKTVSQLASPYPVVFLEGNEDYPELVEKVYGIDLMEYIHNYLDDLDDVNANEEWIKHAVEAYKEDSFDYPDDLAEEDEDAYDEIRKDVFDTLRYLDVNFKGIKGYVVIDDVNNHIEKEYDTEYPAYYEEDNRNYIFGVLYEEDKVSDIKEIIDGI